MRDGCPHPRLPDNPRTTVTPTTHDPRSAAPTVVAMCLEEAQSRRKNRNGLNSYDEARNRG